MPGLRKGRYQRSWRAARQQERRMAFLTFLKNLHGFSFAVRIDIRNDKYNKIKRK